MMFPVLDQMVFHLYQHAILKDSLHHLQILITLPMLFEQYRNKSLLLITYHYLNVIAIHIYLLNFDNHLIDFYLLILFLHLLNLITFTKQVSHNEIRNLCIYHFINTFCIFFVPIPLTSVQL